MYKPHLWMVIKLNEGNPNAKVYYRVLGSWRGGYLDGDSWRLNSGITKAVEDDEFIQFHGASGSIYECRKGAYGSSPYATGVLSQLMEKQPELNIQIMDESTNFLELNYE